MRQVLINEGCNEKPNAQALGAFNATVKKGEKIAKDFMQNHGKKEAIGFWRYNMIKGAQKENTKEYALAKGAYRVIRSI